MADTTIGTSVAIATPDLEIIEGQITTTSQQIAEHFGKRHADVIRAIRKLEAPDDFTERNFALSEFTDSTGRKLPAYRITRDGFTLLAMGFTGKEAMQWKVAYLTAFNKMEQELLARTPYSVQPSDTLTEAQQQTLRALLESNVKRLPHAKQAGAMVKGWSKLKAHFGVPYRQIPASEFTEAISIVARHVAEWDVIEHAQPEPAAQPSMDRTRAAFDAAAQAAASVQTAVFNAVLSGNDEWKYSRWMLAFIDDSAKGSPAYVRQLEHGAFITTWPRLVRDVGTGECMCSSAELLDMAAACMQRLQQRGGPARLAA